MSNLISGQWKQYYQIPLLPEAIEQSLSLSAFRYWAFLCRKLNEHSAPVLEFSSEEISQFTGIKDRKTQHKARLELARFVAVQRVPPGIYRHTVLNHLGEPIPAPKGRRGIKRYEPRSRVDGHLNRKPVQAVTHSCTFSQCSDAVVNHSCLIHGENADHWIREGEAVCASCHPDPTRSIAPSKQDLGF